MHALQSYSFRLRPRMKSPETSNAETYGSISLPSSSKGQEEGGAMKPKGSSIASGVVNLANTIVGAGMLGLPGAFGGTGLLSGIVLIAASATFSAHGLVLLSKAACLTGRPSSFYSVAMAAVPKYTVLIDMAVALKCFGVATGYLITISDSMVNALDHIILTGDPSKDGRFYVSILLSRHFWVVGALVSVLPFSFYRTLDELKKASALALVFVFMLVGMIVAYASGIADPCMGNEDGGSCRGEIEPYTDFSSTLSKLPIFVFAFTCQQNIFPIVNEIELLSQRRLNIVICSSITFALVLFTAVATEGYRTYGSMVSGDILLNYPENFEVTFLRMCIAFMLALHYPLQLDPSRRCITSLVKVVKKQWTRKKRLNRGNGGPTTLVHAGDHLGEIEMEQEESKSKGLSGDSYHEMSRSGEDQAKSSESDENLFYIITLSFLSLSFCLAMVVDDLGVILALVGATGSTLVSYVLPGLIYVKVYPHNDISMAMAYLQLGLGILIIPLALYFIITKQINH